MTDLPGLRFKTRFSIMQYYIIDDYANGWRKQRIILNVNYVN